MSVLPCWYLESPREYGEAYYAQHQLAQPLCKIGLTFLLCTGAVQVGAVHNRNHVSIMHRYPPAPWYHCPQLVLKNRKDIHSVPVIWSTSGPSKIDHIAEMKIFPKFQIRENIFQRPYNWNKAKKTIYPKTIYPKTGTECITINIVKGPISLPCL